MDKFDKDLGSRIKKLRNARGMSQEILADKLKIKRVSLSQIENGERRVTAEEVAKIANLFNIQTDILLDLESEIEVVLNKQKPSSKNKQEIRINVPQKNLEKFRQALLYILGKVGSKPNIGETVLYKIFYFIDFNFYEKFEEQFIGATYTKNHYGPTPNEFHAVVEDMEKNKEITRVKNKYFSYPQVKYLPLQEPDLSMINATEIKMIDEVLKKFSDMNAAQISEYSHGDVPWLTTDRGKIIDYEKVFYRTPSYSMRPVDDEKF